MPPEETTTETVDTETDVEVTTETTTAPDAGDLQAELDEVRKALKKANSEAAKRRKELEAYEQAETERKQAEMTELEKLQAKFSAMETRAKEAEAARDLMAKRQQFYAAIAKADLQFANEQARQDAVLLVDLSEMDDDEIEEEIEKLQKERPYLFRSSELPDIDGHKRGGEKPGDHFSQLVEEAKRRQNVT